MDTQNIIDNAEETKFCSHCKKTKPVTEFTRQSRNKILKFARCNPCNKQDRQSRKNTRATNAESISSLTLNNDNVDETEIDADENNEDELVYDFYDIEKLVSANFKNNEVKNNHIEFSVKVKIEKELVNENALMPEFNQYNESKNFRKIIDVLVMPLQTGLGYYWEH
ncbi:2404_t:CDS:1 [Cetraspora pellucida]|uniref:2404_t:CDS:1 n=1 Tax=Cetraspora pellucida TaxID=1433469 RepID=A0A9N9JED8_9GLOM|nr:2404_t:CDS:1 [Cetraspora pellucida]